MQKKIYKKAIVFITIIIFFGASFTSVTSLKIYNNKIHTLEIHPFRNPLFPTDFIFDHPIKNKEMNPIGSVFINIGQCVQQIHDNGYIVTGFKQKFDFRNPGSGIIQNTIIMKHNANGEGEWKKTFEFMNGNMGNSIQQTDDKGFIIGGSAVSSDISYALLLKTDDQGNEEWKKTYQGFKNSMANSVQQTADKGFILTGSSSSSNDENITLLLLLKTDEVGNVEWNKTFYYDNISMGYSVQQTEDMGYIITGGTGNFEFLPGSLNINFKVLVLKTDISGNIEWSKIFEFMDIDIGYSVQQTKDKGYIIGGTTILISSYTSHALLLKLDELGNEQWHKTLAKKNGRSVQQTEDNGYILGGTNTASSKAMLLKTDENGNEQWTKTYKGLGISVGISVKQTVDKGFILTGSTSKSIYSLKTSTYLVKTDENGNLVWNKALIKNNHKLESNIKYNHFRILQKTFLQKFFEKSPVLKRLLFLLISQIKDMLY